MVLLRDGEGSRRIQITEFPVVAAIPLALTSAGRDGDGLFLAYQHDKLLAPVMPV